MVDPTRRPWAAFAFLAATVALTACGSDAPTPASSADPAIAESVPTVFACGAPSTPIAKLVRDPSRVRQRLEPAVVDVEAIVVGNFQGGLGGFFLQSADGEDDGDPATAEGLFVEHRSESPAPRVGRRLRVRGQWDASDDAARAELALRRVESIADCGDAALPAAIELRDAPADWSRYAGMRVHAPGPLTLTGNDHLLRYGELWLSFGDRLISPTELVLPGGAADVRAQDDARRLLVVDDGRGGEYPRRLWHLRRDPGPDAPYRTGSTVRDIEGILERRFGGWRVQLTAPIGRIEQAARPSAPRRNPALMRIASFNVLNFFNGDGRDGGFPTARGAGSRNDMRRQRDKLVVAMLALDADVYALMELENDGHGNDSAVAELAEALSRALGGNALAHEEDRPVEVESQDARYLPVDTGTPTVGSDVIAVGLIYRGDRVRPIGEARQLHGGPFDEDSRVPLAQAFAPIRPDGQSQRPVLVVVNHFKSKGCRDARAADTDQGDGQSCFAATRTQSARELVRWLRDMPAQSGLEQALILGDLNAHTREDPIRTLTGAGLTDVLDQRDGGYSFVYEGRAGRLDHALAGRVIAKRTRDAGIWHINADELPEFDYDGDARSGRRLYADDPYRSSDHDPVWIDIEP